MIEFPAQLTDGLFVGRRTSKGIGNLKSLFGGTEGIDDLTKKLSQNWGILITILPTREKMQIDAGFMQADLALSILDYLGLASRSEQFSADSIFCPEGAVTYQPGAEQSAAPGQIDKKHKALSGRNKSMPPDNVKTHGREPDPSCLPPSCDAPSGLGLCWMVSPQGGALRLTPLRSALG